MAKRTNEPAVRDIIATTLTSEQVNRYIDDASLWVTEELAVLTPALSNDRLEVVERWLAAALCRVRDLGITDGTIEDVREKYQVDPKITDYLFRAASFDPTGTVRRHFLAPQPAAEPQEAPYNPITRVGTGFRDDV